MDLDVPISPHLLFIPRESGHNQGFKELVPKRAPAEEEEKEEEVRRKRRRRRKVPGCGPGDAFSTYFLPNLAQQQAAGRLRHGSPVEFVGFVTQPLWIFFIFHGCWLSPFPGAMRTPGGASPCPPQLGQNPARDQQQREGGSRCRVDAWGDHAGLGCPR